MKAYLIDPFEKSIKEVDYSGDWQDISRLIGCKYFTAVNLNDDQDTVYVDDEGLLVDQGDMEYFHISMAPGYEQTLAGKGLVLGTNKDGDTVAPLCDIKWLDGIISYPPADKVKMPDSFTVYAF
jgi:hypothetical protein